PLWPAIPALLPPVSPSSPKVRARYTQALGCRDFLPAAPAYSRPPMAEQAGVGPGLPGSPAWTSWWLTQKARARYMQGLFSSGRPLLSAGYSRRRTGEQAGQKWAPAF